MAGPRDQDEVVLGRWKWEQTDKTYLKGCNWRSKSDRSSSAKSDLFSCAVIGRVTVHAFHLNNVDQGHKDPVNPLANLKLLVVSLIPKPTSMTGGVNCTYVMVTMDTSRTGKVGENAVKYGKSSLITK